MPLFRKKSPPDLHYDPKTQEVAVRKSICTGEMTLGFIDRETGQFHDVMLVDRETLESVLRSLKAEHVKTIY